MITKRVAVGIATAGAVLIGVGVYGGLPAEAGRIPAADHPAADESAARKVATGLDNPRGLAFGPHGELYVAEAGTGGAGPCRTGGEGEQVCFGASGAITEVVRGRQYRVVKHLPSLAAAGGAQAIGPSDVAVGRDGRLYFTVGLGAAPAVRDQVRQLSGMAKLYRVTGRGPAVAADPGGFEQRVNPDGVQPPDTNPNSVLSVHDGELVADAGGNSLVRANPRGRLSTVATFGPRTVTGPDGKPAVMQAVPTSVVTGPDGAFYVGELTGFPFVKGAARVWRVVPGHRPTVYATGFTNIIDLAWGPDHKLYVLEIAKNGLLSGDQAGALLRVERHGPARVVVGSGLTAPGGLAIRGHEAYISNCSVCAGRGAVLRYVLR
jgi:hypothetical protein